MMRHPLFNAAFWLLLSIGSIVAMYVVWMKATERMQHQEKQPKIYGHWFQNEDDTEVLCVMSDYGISCDWGSKRTIHQ